MSIVRIDPYLHFVRHPAAPLGHTAAALSHLGVSCVAVRLEPDAPELRYVSVKFAPGLLTEKPTGDPGGAHED